MMSRPLPDSECQVHSPDTQIIDHSISPLSGFILFGNKGFGACGSATGIALYRP